MLIIISGLMLIVTNANNADCYDGSNVNWYGWIRMLLIGAKRLSSYIMECVARS